MTFTAWKKEETNTCMSDVVITRPGSGPEYGFHTRYPTLTLAARSTPRGQRLRFQIMVLVHVLIISDNVLLCCQNYSIKYQLSCIQDVYDC